MSRAVERQDPNVQRFLPQSSLHKHRLEASMNARDERLSPDGTRSRRGPRHPADDQSPEMQEWAITSGKRRLKTTSTVSIEQIQKHADDQQRLGGEFLPPLNSYAWDDAESSTSGSSVTTAEEDLLAHSGMDGADDNMLKVQKCLTPINSGPERDAAQQGMTTEDATGGFYEATSQGSSSPSKQQRQQNRLTAIKCPIANAEVPWESGEGCAEARPNAGISTGIHDMSEINVVAKWTPGAGSEVDIGHQGKPPPHEQASRPRWYRRASSASTRKRSLRRYSFDKGDDEVLPVTSSAKACDTTFDQPREDVSCPPQVHVQEGTFQAGRRTTVAPSTSTGSVVWIGKEEAVTDKVSKQGTSVGYGLPKITVSGVGGESGDCSGDNDGGARRSVLLVGGPFSSLSPSSSSPNLQSAADSSHRGGNAARIAAERAVARQSGGGVGRK
ncbi:hypothetical protein QBC38DRAFT_162288 [Podospora fimiseda]|uniref:Uncharacterized protein n=1 Tax=Podospora fimiseda TaxID=252190 RepID=A0AAN7H5F9_9PEZI|nr:hypothetical protein QBC38DRAFT_162288 [Podospora fimiseda]